MIGKSVCESQLVESLRASGHLLFFALRLVWLWRWSQGGAERAKPAKGRKRFGRRKLCRTTVVASGIRK